MQCITVSHLKPTRRNDMNDIIGKLLTGYALYSLTGAGLVVIFWCFASFYIVCEYGFIAEGFFILASYIAFDLVCSAIAQYINKNSLYFGNRANWENRKKDD